MIVICAVVVIASILFIYVNNKSLKKSNDHSDYQEVEKTELADPNQIENGIHVRTGLVAGEGLTEVVNNCTNCHSAQLVIQNRMSAERWAATIRWMQETQNLWDLGKNEEIIINYLVTNYPPENTGRRAALKDIEWYELK
jgi:hypothetical protein